jgi:hypothetical protein
MCVYVCVCMYVCVCALFWIFPPLNYCINILHIHLHTHIHTHTHTPTVALDYNAGFQSALAGLKQLSAQGQLGDPK